MGTEGPHFPLTKPIPPGTILYLGPEAGIQWRIRPIRLLVIRETDIQTTWHGTVYIDGFELESSGRKISRRVYVIKEGLRRDTIWPQSGQMQPRQQAPAQPQPRQQIRFDALAVR